MRTNKQLFKYTALSALLFIGFSAGGIAQDTGTIITPETKAPFILETSPTSGEVNVDLGNVIKITFNSEMDEKSIDGNTLQLHATYADTLDEDHREVLLYDQITDSPVTIKYSENRWQYSTATIGGTISYSNKVAVFTPDSQLKEGTLYTFTVTSGVKSSRSIALENDYSWGFTTIGTSESIYD